MVMRVFWLNIAEYRVYLWYVYCSKLFRRLRREKWCDSGVRKELNFGNKVTEILFAQIQLPNWWSAWRRSARKEKKPIVVTKLPKFKGSEGREKGLWQPSCWRKKKKTEIVGEKKGIVATKLLKMRGNKKKKKKKKSSCRKMFPMACKLFHIFCELVATSTPTVAPVMLVLPYLPSTK